MSVIAIASGLASAVGLGKKIGELLDAKNGAEVADRVVDMAKLITGAPSGEHALETLNADPEARLRFEEALVDSEVKLQRIAHLDRVDARALQVATLQANRGWLASNFLYLMTTILLLFAFGFAAAVTFIPLSPTGERYADLIMTGLVAGLVGGVVRFFYGGGKPQQPAELGGKNLRDLGDYGK